MRNRHHRHAEQMADADLRFYFSADNLFWRSPMGGMLERARSERFDSNNRPIPRPREWDWLPDVGNHKPDPHMVLSSAKRSEGGGYEPDGDDVLRHGSISRRIRELIKKSRGPSGRHYDVLQAFYADRGARWAAASQDRFDRDGRLLAKGIGPGALAAIYPLTPSGRLLIQRERSMSTTFRPRLALVAEKAAVQKEAHDTAREALETEIEEVTSKLEGMERRRKEAESSRSVILAEIAKLRAEKITPSTTLRDRATRTDEEVAIVRSEEAELQRILFLLRHTLANSATPTSLPAPQPPPAQARQAWLEEFTSKMNPYEKDLACYHAEKLRREQAIVERGSLLRRLSKEGPISADDPRLPVIPPEPTKPIKPHGMAMPNAPQARLPTLYDQQTSPVADMSDDDVLEVAFLLQRRNNATLSRRKVLLDKAREEATRMFVQATEAWLEITRKNAPPSSPPPGTKQNYNSPQVTSRQNAHVGARSAASLRGFDGRGQTVRGDKDDSGPASETRVVGRAGEEGKRGKVVAA